MHQTSDGDEVTLVDAADNVVGRMDKKAAHRYPLFLHRAASVWLFRKNGTELLLQQRSAKKITGAGWWGNTICGNVWPDESYDDCALRRLAVEMGISTAQLQEAYSFMYKAYVNDEYGEFEMDRVFIGKYDWSVKPNHAEVSDFLWVNWQQLQDQVKATIAAKKIEYPHSSATLSWSKAQLKLKTIPLEVEIGNRKLQLVPWTVMMILDGKLPIALVD